MMGERTDASDDKVLARKALPPLLFAVLFGSRLGLCPVLHVEREPRLRLLVGLEVLLVRVHREVVASDEKRSVAEE